MSWLEDSAAFHLGLSNVFGRRSVLDTMEKTMRPAVSRTSSNQPPTQPKVRLERNVDSLRELRSADTTFRQVDLCLGQKRLLHRQPWRQPVRPASQFSLLERIRRFEISLRQH
jgi:hypothetical protein